MNLNEVITFFQDQLIGKVKFKSVEFSGWYEPQRIETDGTVYCDYFEYNGRHFFIESFTSKLLLQRIADGSFKVERPDPFPDMAKVLLES